uniref:Dioxygenase n=1 Tax=Hemiselmis tepida TaxID=464990 RepID=A0A7S0VV95_9CRYP
MHSVRLPLLLGPLLVLLLGPAAEGFTSPPSQLRPSLYQPSARICAHAPLSGRGGRGRIFLGRLRASSVVEDGTAPQTQEDHWLYARDGGYDQEAFLRGFNTAAREDAAYEQAFEGGPVPKELLGTYYRNGHCRLEDGNGDRLRHPFDGDGMVLGITIDPDSGTAVVRNRWVRTEQAEAEKAAKKPLFARTFGNALPWWDGGLTFKNVANTAVMWHKGALYALWEGGRPHELDPLSLETKGEVTLDGNVGTGVTDTFSAHPRLHAASDTLIGFSYFGNPVTGETPITFWQFENAEGGPAGPGGAGKPKEKQGKLTEKRPKQTHTVPGFAFVHDVAVTDNFFVVSNAPVHFEFSQMPRWIAGAQPIMDCLNYDETKPTCLHLMRRNGAGVPVTVPLDPHFAFHHANAYEEDGKLILDTAAYTGHKGGVGFLDPNPQPGLTVYERMDLEKDPKSRITRYTVDLATLQFTKEVLCDRYSEFPVINPRCSGSRHRYVWALCSNRRDGKSAATQALCKVDTQDGGRSTIWMPDPWVFCGEPEFVPKEGGTEEDDGFILTLLYDGKRDSSELAVFDASAVEKGPITRLPLRTAVPHGLHGTWVGGLAPSLEEIQRREEGATFLGRH